VPYEPPTHDLRASDADRERTVERLRVAALEGRLDSDELEERLTEAYGARWCSQLERLTYDVTPVSAPAPAPVAPTFVRPARRVNGLAVASVVAAVLWMWWLGSFAAVVMGHAALRQIARSGGKQTGRSAALAGLSIGYFGLVTLLFVLLFAAA
jgi:Domain of unknown function (DUF1707)/Domain of unknown function (DUF4190)